MQLKQHIKQFQPMLPTKTNRQGSDPTVNSSNESMAAMLGTLDEHTQNMGAKNTGNKNKENKTHTNSSLSSSPIMLPPKLQFQSVLGWISIMNDTRFNGSPMGSQCLRI